MMTWGCFFEREKLRQSLGGHEQQVFLVTPLLFGGQASVR
jgi:hypothetical protein